MSATTPYGRIVGPVKFYVAAVSTAEPAVNTTPDSNWTELGATDGDQSAPMKDAANEYLYDNDHQGPVKAVTPQENGGVKATLVNMTHALLARILNSSSKITTAAGPPAVSRVPLKAGYIPGEYALLAKGASDSPFGDYPAQCYIPRGCFEKTFEIPRGKGAGSSAKLAFEFKILEDDTQTEDNRMGWMTAQTS